MNRISVGCVSIGHNTINTVAMALRKGRISQGEAVAEFEKRFADYHSVKNCVAVSTGTAANTIALSVLRENPSVDKDKEVILPALTFVSCANSIIHAGFKPVFVDVDPNTYHMDVEAACAAITPKTVAILPVHLFGRPMDLRGFYHNKNVLERKLPLIEDCAEAHGAELHGKKVGTMGDCGTFSFYVAHIITCGEGGAIITNSDHATNIMRSLRAHGRLCACKQCVMNISSGYCKRRFEDGQDKRFSFARIGYSEKMQEVSAILGIEQVHNLDSIILKRRENTKRLLAVFSKYETEFKLPGERPFEKTSPLCFPVVIREAAKFGRTAITARFEKNGIETRSMFSSIPTQEQAYEYLGEKRGKYPVAEYIGEHGFYIGCHQNITANDIDHIKKTLDGFMENQ